MLRCSRVSNQTSMLTIERDSKVELTNTMYVLLETMRYVRRELAVANGNGEFIGERSEKVLLALESAHLTLESMLADIQTAKPITELKLI